LGFRQPDRSVVGRFDAALFRQEIDEEFLSALRIHGTQPDRQHELRQLEGDLQRPQMRKAEL
jgi:hypothetical protein